METGCVRALEARADVDVEDQFVQQQVIGLILLLQEGHLLRHRPLLPKPGRSPVCYVLRNFV